MSLAAAAGAALAVRLVEWFLEDWSSQDSGSDRARRRVELQERAEVLEAELEGIHLVRESAPAPELPPGGGLFGPVPPAEA